VEDSGFSKEEVELKGLGAKSSGIQGGAHGGVREEAPKYSSGSDP